MDRSKDDRIFRNAFLESLTRTHIAVPLIIFYGTGLGLFIYTYSAGNLSLMRIVAMLACGFLFFTLVEYLVHRYLFHIITDTPTKERFQYMFHGVHHDHPRDKTRLAMPPVVSVVLASLLTFFFWLIMGEAGLPFAAGFVSGYATYLCVHYSVHAFDPPDNFLRILWKHHGLHHHRFPEKAFGVSSIIWDVVFRTMPDKTYYEKPANRRV